MRAVNLLPPERRSRGGTQTFGLRVLTDAPLLPGVVAIIALAVIGIGVWAHAASSGVSGKEDRLAALQSELAASREKSLATAGPSAASRLNDVVSLAASRMPWDAFLSGFARVVPEDVWLLSLSANPEGVAAGSPTPSASSSTAAAVSPLGSSPVTISGYTYSQASVARLIDRLSLIPWLTDVQLQNSSLTQLGNRLVYQFAIGASMVNGGEGVAS